MTDQIYRELYQNLAARGFQGPLYDIPEFYDLVEALFTPEEAAVACAQTPGERNRATASDLAAKVGWPEDKVAGILDTMVTKGTCFRIKRNSIRYFVPPETAAIINLNFMRGTSTERDKRIAKLVRSFKEAHQAKTGIMKLPLPAFRVISIEETIPGEDVTQTYDQVSNYIENADPISISLCYCRQEAELINSDDRCDVPIESCMSFNRAAEYIIEGNFGRKISKEEAYFILDECEKAGLVHTGLNAQEIDNICNCCFCHCSRLKRGMSQTQKVIAGYSGFFPKFNIEACESCQYQAQCIDRCPTNAISQSKNAIEEDTELCIGCGLCARNCVKNTVVMQVKENFEEPPKDWAALEKKMIEGIMKGRS